MNLLIVVITIIIFFLYSVQIVSLKNKKQNQH